MHPLRLLLDILPLILVEQRRVPRPRRPLAILPLARRFPRRAQDREERDAGQQHEFVPVPHDPELLEDVSKGVESREGDCGDQEDDGFYLSGVWGVGEGGRYAWMAEVCPSLLGRAFNEMNATDLAWVGTRTIGL